MRKLVVYLDTSDFAEFSKATPSEVHQQTLDTLRQLVVSEKIVLAYSPYHLGELLRDFDDQHFENRLDRAKVISSLCGRNCMRHLFADELPGALADDGSWFPTNIPLPTYTKHSMLREARESLAEDPRWASFPRHERRRIGSKKFLLDYIRTHSGVFDPLPLGEEIPQPQAYRDKNVFYDFLMGRATNADIGEYLSEYFRDPELLVHLLKHSPSNRGVLAKTIDGMFANLDAAAAGFNEEMEQLRSSFQRLRNAERELKVQQDKLRKHGVPVKPYKRSLRPPPPIDDSQARYAAMVEKLQNSGTTSKFPNLIYPYAAYLNDSTTSNRERKPSDAIDIFHASYLPNVDIWRGDTYFSTMLIRQKIPGHEKIVPKIGQLIDRILMALD